MAIESAEELSEMAEVSPDVEVESEMEMEGEELPSSLLGGMDVAPGDVVRITVVSAPDETGVWRGRYATGKPKASAIDEAAEAITATGEPV